MTDQAQQTATQADSQTRHTPGPWRWEPSHHSVVQPNGDNVLVGPSYKANARLIAAAPDLLEAAELARATVERLNRHGSANGTLDVLSAAIAKATGEA